jgi:hypothetical protein
MTFVLASVPFVIHSNALSANRHILAHTTTGTLHQTSSVGANVGIEFEDVHLSSQGIKCHPLLNTNPPPEGSPCQNIILL